MNLQCIDELYAQTIAKQPHELIRNNLRPTLEHPNFTSTAVHSRRLMARHMADHVGKNDLSQLSVLALHLAIIYYHCHRQLSAEHRSKSITKLKQYVESTAIASGRQVSNIVSRFIDMGRVVRQPSATDNRVHWLVPTPEMIKTSIAYGEVMVEPLSAMGVSDETITRLKTDPVFQEAYLYHMCRLWISGCDCFLSYKVFRRLAAKSRGLAVSTNLLLETSETHGTLFEEKPIRFSIKTLAENARVSRSQMRILLDDMQRSDDLVVDYAAHELTVTRKFAVASECAMAACVIMNKQALGLANASPLLAMTG